MTEEQKEKRRQQARENGKKGSRPPKYASAEELEKAVDDYFASHTTKDNIPKWPQMLNELNVSDSTLLRYRTDEKYIKLGYADVIKKAERMFSDTLMQLAVDHPNLQSLVIFLLKQPHNGGYTDKQQVDSNNKHSIEIDIKGI